MYHTRCFFGKISIVKQTSSKSAKTKGNRRDDRIRDLRSSNPRSVPGARIYPRNSCASVGGHLSIRRIRLVCASEFFEIFTAGQIISPNYHKCAMIPRRTRTHCRVPGDKCNFYVSSKPTYKIGQCALLRSP